MSHLEDQVDSLIDLCSEMRAELRELKVRQETLEGLVKHYARRLDDHAAEDRVLASRVGSLEISRATLRGTWAGVALAGTILGSAIGAVVSWLIGR